MFLRFWLYLIYVLYISFIDTDEELNEWKFKFDERIAILESKISKLLREKEDVDEKVRVLTEVNGENTKDIAKLQAASEVTFISLL